MQKQSSTQKVKIKTLESEIERMKTQKVVLMKQMKEESEKHRKWKADRVKELMQMKS
jgi:kinesin family protein 4/21/27